MATYVFRCPLGHAVTFDGPAVEGAPIFVECSECGGQATRDYRAESVGIDMLSLRPDANDRTRRSAALFLPKPEDFAGPKDPDGMKGLRAWQETKRPRDGNTKPAWPSDLAGGGRTSF